MSERSQATRLFDRAYASPFGFSPTGMQGLIRPGGEVMMARAAAEAGIPYILSGLTTAARVRCCRGTEQSLVSAPPQAPIAAS